MGSSDSMDGRVKQKDALTQTHYVSHTLTTNSKAPTMNSNYILCFIFC